MSNRVPHSSKRALYRPYVLDRLRPLHRECSSAPFSHLSRDKRPQKSTLQTHEMPERVVRMSSETSTVNAAPPISTVARGAVEIVREIFGVKRPSVKTVWISRLQCVWTDCIRPLCGSRRLEMLIRTDLSLKTSFSSRHNMLPERAEAKNTGRCVSLNRVAVNDTASRFMDERWMMGRGVVHSTHLVCSNPPISLTPCSPCWSPLAPSCSTISSHGCIFARSMICTRSRRRPRILSSVICSISWRCLD